MKAKIVIHMRSGRAVEVPIDGDVVDAAKLDTIAATFTQQHFPAGQYTQFFRFGLLMFVVANVDTIEFVEDTGASEVCEPVLQTIGQDVGQIRTLVSKQLEQGTKQMATLAEVQQDIEEMRVAAQRNADAADAMVVLVKQLMDMVGDAAASATDLAGLKESLDLITEQVNAKADAMVAAAQQPPPAPAPAP